MAETVDAYLAELSPPRRERLDALRAAVHRAVPGVTESIEWKMPVFRHGEPYVAFASRAAFVSVDIGRELVATVAAAVPGLKSGKGCLNIADRVPLPLAALEAAFRARLLP